MLRSGTSPPDNDIVISLRAPLFLRTDLRPFGVHRVSRIICTSLPRDDGDSFAYTSTPPPPVSLRTRNNVFSLFSAANFYGGPPLPISLLLANRRIGGEKKLRPARHFRSVSSVFRDTFVNFRPQSPDGYTYVYIYIRTRGTDRVATTTRIIKHKRTTVVQRNDTVHERRSWGEEGDGYNASRIYRATSTPDGTRRRTKND